MEKEILCYSLDHSESYDICHLKIELSEIDKENIKKSVEILKENKFISHLRIDVNSRVTYLDIDKNNYYSDVPEEDMFKWRLDVEQFIVYTNSVFYYAQNKWDNGDYFESTEISINEILE